MCNYLIDEKELQRKVKQLVVVHVNYSVLFLIFF